MKKLFNCIYIMLLCCANKTEFINTSRLLKFFGNGPNGEKFYGNYTFDEQRRLIGFGKMKFGFGKRKFTQKTYKGYWEKGRLNYGKITHKRIGFIHIYRGELKHGPHFYYQNHNSSGVHMHPMEHGKGKKIGINILHYKGNYHYEGDFKDGVFDGYGKYCEKCLSFYDSSRHINSYKSNLPPQKIKNGLYELSKCCYEGTFAQGKKHGEGNQTWEEGFRFEGNWHCNEFYEGSLITPGGKLYRGHWSNQQLTKGILILGNTGKVVITGNQSEFPDGFSTNWTTWNDRFITHGFLGYPKPFR